MTRYTKLDIIDFLLTESPSAIFLKPFSAFPFETTTDFDLALELLNPTIPSLDLISPFDELHTITDLIKVERRTPFGTTSARKIINRRRCTTAELYLQSLSNRVSALELGFDLVKEEKVKSDRKYSWTAFLP